MFKDKQGATDRPASSNSATLISSGTVLRGDLKSETDLRIDGSIHGNVSSTAKIIIGPSGFVEGNIHSQLADIMGRVQGNLAISDLVQLRGQCIISGDIHAGKLQVDPTAVFNGKCQMGEPQASVVSMSNQQDVPAAKAK